MYEEFIKQQLLSDNFCYLDQISDYLKAIGFPRAFRIGTRRAQSKIEEVF